MATLYVRNIPADLHEELQRWASEGERSVNAEVIDLLRRESERRRADDDVTRSLATYFDRYADKPVSVPDAVELIREGREHDWLHEYGL